MPLPVGPSGCLVGLVVINVLITKKKLSRLFLDYRNMNY